MLHCVNQLVANFVCSLVLGSTLWDHQGFFAKKKNSCLLELVADESGETELK